MANLVTLHNVNAMTNVLTELKDEGTEITEELVAGLAPYRVAHINRFGDYSLNPGSALEAMNFRADFLQ